MNFHVVSRGGFTINFDFPAVWSCLNCSNKIIEKIPSLAHVILINLLYLVRQADKFLSYYFCKRKSYSILMFFIVIIMLILVENCLIRLSDRSYFSSFFLPFYISLLFLENVLLSQLFYLKNKIGIYAIKYRFFPRSLES